MQCASRAWDAFQIIMLEIVINDLAFDADYAPPNAKWPHISTHLLIWWYGAIFPRLPIENTASSLSGCFFTIFDAGATVKLYRTTHADASRKLPLFSVAGAYYMFYNAFIIRISLKGDNIFRPLKTSPSCILLSRGALSLTTKLHAFFVVSFVTCLSEYKFPHFLKFYVDTLLFATPPKFS